MKTFRLFILFALCHLALGISLRAQGVFSNLDVQKSLKLGSAPAAAVSVSLTADQNNYAPTGIAAAICLRVTTDASRTITGIDPGLLPPGRFLLIDNVGTHDLVLASQSASSTAANRFAFADDVTLTGDQSVLLRYDYLSLRWRLYGGSGSGGTGGSSPVDDTAYDATSWDGDSVYAPTKNAVRDQIETMLASIALKAPLASPTLTGTPVAPTAAVDTNTTQIATTAFVLAQAASATPLIDGTAAAGSSTRYARGDHIHPTDTTRAPLASPSFMGIASVPTKTGSFAVGSYGTISETGGGLAYITGNAIKASTTVDNQLIKTQADPANFIRMRYDGGISFHTNITGASASTAADDANQRGVFTLNGNFLLGTTSETGLSGAGGLKISGIFRAGSSNTAVTDSAGKILSAALNTVAAAQGGTGLTALSSNTVSFLGAADYAAMRSQLDLEAGTDFLGYPTGTPTGSKYLRDDNSWQTIAGGGDALVANPLSQFAATSSSQLRGVLSDESGTGVILTDNGTLTAGTIAGATNLTGTMNFAINTITITTNAGVIDVTKPWNSATNGAATTLTFSTDNVAATRKLVVDLNNSDGSNARVFTMDTVTDFAETVPAGQRVTITVKSNGASGWAKDNGGGNVLDLTPNATPATTKRIEIVDATTGLSESTSLAQAVTTQIDTMSELEAILSSTNIITATEIDTLSELDALVQLPVEICVAASDETTALTATTGKVTFRAPYAFTITAVRCSVNTAPTGSTILVDINESGTTILSTKLMIDATEKTSTTAATAAVISDAAIADDAEISIDVDQIGSTVAGAGLKVWIIGYR